MLGRSSIARVLWLGIGVRSRRSGRSCSTTSRLSSRLFGYGEIDGEIGAGNMLSTWARHSQ